MKLCRNADQNSTQFEYFLSLRLMLILKSKFKGGNLWIGYNLAHLSSLCNNKITKGDMDLDLDMKPCRNTTMVMIILLFVFYNTYLVVQVFAINLHKETI